MGFFLSFQLCLASRSIKINFHSTSTAGQTIQMPLLFKETNKLQEEIHMQNVHCTFTI